MASNAAKKRARNLVDAWWELPDATDGELVESIATALDAHAEERVRAERQTLIEQIRGALSIAKRQAIQEPEKWQGFIRACEAICNHIEERNEAMRERDEFAAEERSRYIIAREEEDEWTILGTCPYVVESDHPRFTPGHRFDFGFTKLALSEGYTVTLLPVEEAPDA